MNVVSKKPASKRGARKSLSDLPLCLAKIAELKRRHAMREFSVRKEGRLISDELGRLINRSRELLKRGQTTGNLFEDELMQLFDFSIQPLGFALAFNQIVIASSGKNSFIRFEVEEGRFINVLGQLSGDRIKLVLPQSKKDRLQVILPFAHRNVAWEEDSGVPGDLVIGQGALVIDDFFQIGSFIQKLTMPSSGSVGNLLLLTGDMFNMGIAYSGFLKAKEMLGIE
ncbi:MAG: hypothetical protein WC763_00890 [Candidatus Paceibacterota bacterium]|jgi:hypothetical protein